MYKGPFMTALSFFINLDKSHFLQNFIEKHVVYFVLCWWRDVQCFNNSIIFFDEFLSNIFFIIEIEDPSWEGSSLLILALISFCSLLSSHCILVKKFIDRGISCELSSFLCDFRVKIISESAISIIFIFLIFKGIKSFENCSIFLLFLNTNIGFWLECVFFLFLSI